MNESEVNVFGEARAFEGSECFCMCGITVSYEDFAAHLQSPYHLNFEQYRRRLIDDDLDKWRKEWICAKADPVQTVTTLKNNETKPPSGGCS